MATLLSIFTTAANLVLSIGAATERERRGGLFYISRMKFQIHSFHSYINVEFQLSFVSI